MFSRNLSLCLLWFWLGGVAAAGAQDEAASQPPEEAEAPAKAESLAAEPVVHAPIGGRAFTLGDLGVACDRVPGPFRTVANGRVIVPPDQASAIGRPVRTRVARDRDACRGSGRSIVLIATGPLPRLAPESVVLSADEGRVDATGHRLDGAVLWWQSRGRSGTDVCRNPEDVGGAQRCAWSTGSDVPADPDATVVGVYPRGSQPGPPARFFDARGRPVVAPEPDIKPARIVLQRVLPAEASVDLAVGTGELSILHPEAVGAAECRPLDCEIREGAVIVRGGSAPVDSFEVTLRLRPRVQIRNGNRYDTQVSGTVAVLHCPMAIVSGDPFRQNDDATVVLQLRGLCARDVPLLTFRADRRRLSVGDIHHQEDGTLVQLQLGYVAGDQVMITASRKAAAAPVVVAVANGRTRPVPSLRAVLEVPRFPNVDFVPTNRWAAVHVAHPDDETYAVALPIPGVYETRYEDERSYVRGDPHAAGLTGLRLGLRSTALPEPYRSLDLAVVTDPLLRSVHQANVPTPLPGDPNQPLIELNCGGGPDSEPIQLAVGRTAQLGYGLRDTCRVVFWRSRLDPRFGAQLIRFEIDVYNLDGATRGEAHVAETLTLKPGAEPRKAYVHGISRPFDRLVVRVSHVADETHYLGASEIRTGAPAAKWTVIFGTGHARLYATTAFPTGLYRLSHRDHSGVLSLNFGLLSRLTWLDDEGQEGFLGLETGLVVVGLGNALTSNGRELNQVGAVLGFGLSVPFANRSSSTQASINVHAWLEVDLTRDEASGADGRLAFIFGPSISIGNLGTNL